MRKILNIIIFASLILLANGVYAQSWEYSKEFGTDMWKGPVDHDVDYVNCTTGSREVMSIGICMNKDVADGFKKPSYITDINKTLDGLEDKVARGIEAQRPKRKKTSSSATGTTSNRGSGKAGTSYNHATSQSHIDWVNQKRAQQEEARRREQERKRQEAIRKKIEDDNRAAATTAATNARLQGQTNRRIQNDRYHATVGAQIAQQTARQAHRTVGPQFTKPKMSNANHAKMLRGQKKPRRIMYPQRQPKDTVRKLLAQVERKPQPSLRDSLIQRALKVKAELQQKKAAGGNEFAYKGIKLSDKAVSSLGKDWTSSDLKTGPLAPPPTTAVVKYKEPEWLTQEKNMREMLGEPPLTQDEEHMMLLLDEFLEETPSEK